nr:hypothetical protein CFP56_11070 [Quercus suber]
MTISVPSLCQNCKLTVLDQVTHCPLLDSFTSTILAGTNVHPGRSRRCTRFVTYTKHRTADPNKIQGITIYCCVTQRRHVRECEQNLPDTVHGRHISGSSFGTRGCTVMENRVAYTPRSGPMDDMVHCSLRLVCNRTTVTSALCLVYFVSLQDDVPHLAPFPLQLFQEVMQLPLITVHNSGSLQSHDHMSDHKPDMLITSTENESTSFFSPTLLPNRVSSHGQREEVHDVLLVPLSVTPPIQACCFKTRHKHWILTGLRLAVLVIILDLLLTTTPAVNGTSRFSSSSKSTHTPSEAGTMIFYTILSILFATGSALMPPIRAGGPAIIPIPANCTLTNTVPQTANANTTGGWQLSNDFFNNHTLYQAYYNQSTSRAEDCFEQCYSLSGCKSALFAHNVLTPNGYYDTSPFLAAMGCQLFDDYACPEAFVVAPKGQYTAERGANIACPL